MHQGIFSCRRNGLHERTLCSTGCPSEKLHPCVRIPWLWKALRGAVQPIETPASARAGFTSGVVWAQRLPSTCSLLSMCISFLWIGACESWLRPCVKYQYHACLWFIIVITRTTLFTLQPTQMSLSGMCRVPWAALTRPLLLLVLFKPLCWIFVFFCFFFLILFYF